MAHNQFAIVAKSCGLLLALALAGCAASVVTDRPIASSELQVQNAFVASLMTLNVNDREEVSSRLNATMRLRSENPDFRFWIAEVADHPAGLGRMRVDYRERVAETAGGDLLFLYFDGSRYARAEAEAAFPGLVVAFAPNHPPDDLYGYRIPGGRNEVVLGFHGILPGGRERLGSIQVIPHGTSMIPQRTRPH